MANQFTTKEVLNKVLLDSSGNAVTANSVTAQEALNSALDTTNNRLNMSLAGGTISGDVTISGDLTVNGNGSGTYDEIINGVLIVKTDSSPAFIVEDAAGHNQFQVNVNASTGAEIAVSDGSADSGVERVRFSARSGGDSYITNAGSFGFGIGTTSPQDAVHIKTTADADIGLQVQNDDTQAFCKVQSSGSALYGGNNKITFISGGSYTTALTIGTDQHATFAQNINLGDDKALTLGADGDAQIWNDGSNTYIRNNTSDQDIIFRVNDGGTANTEVMKIDGATASVGIGKTPDTILDIDSGAIGESSAENAGVRITGQRNGNITALTMRHEQASGGATGADNGIGMHFQGYDGSNSYHNMGAIYVRSAENSVSDSDSPGYMTFHTTPNTTDGIEERMRIDSSGRVGIGHQSALRDNLFNTTSLGSALQVEGTTAQGGSIMVTRNTGASAGDLPFIALCKSRGSSLGSNTIISDNDEIGSLSFQGSDGSEFIETASVRARINGTPGSNDMPGELVFYTNGGSTSADERMVIDSTGRVGIGSGAITPSHPLHVATGNNNGLIAEFQNTEATDSQNYGVRIKAGSTSTDYALQVQDHDASNTLFRVSGNGSVGIGTDSPDSNTGFRDRNLTIHGADPSLVISDSGQDNLQICTHANTFKFMNDTDNRAFFTIEENALANSLYIDDSGHIGINNSSPTMELEIYQSALTHGSNVGIRLYAENASGTAKDGHIIFDPDTETVGLSKAGATVDLGVNATTVESIRNVNIDTGGTTSLTVDGNNSSGDDGRIYLHAHTSSGSRAYININNGVSSGGQNWYVGALRGNNSFAVGRGDDFGTNTDFYIDSSGNATFDNNVTIGDASGTPDLKISGTNTGTNLAATGHGASNIILHNASATDDNFSFIDGNNSNDAVDSRIAFIHDSHSSRHGAIAFLLHNGSSLAEKMRIDKDGDVNIVGALSKGSGSFKIDHPLESKKDTHNLVHSFVEAPQADNIYRGKATLSSGSVEINLDTISGMSEGTFVLLNTDIQCFTSNESDWDAVKGSISGNILTISCQNTDSTAIVSWLVIGERQDQHMLDTNWTDENGKVIVEPLKD